MHVSQNEWILSIILFLQTEQICDFLQILFVLLVKREDDIFGDDISSFETGDDIFGDCGSIFGAFAKTFKFRGFCSECMFLLYYIFKYCLNTKD
jgi:hypothetical protein